MTISIRNRYLSGFQFFEDLSSHDEGMRCVALREKNSFVIPSQAQNRKHSRNDTGRNNNWPGRGLGLDLDCTSCRGRCSPCPTMTSRHSRRLVSRDFPVRPRCAARCLSNPTDDVTTHSILGNSPRSCSGGIGFRAAHVTAVRYGRLALRGRQQAAVAAHC